MPAKKDHERYCPKCGAKTKATATCSVCGKVGCVERCNTAGTNAPCEACASRAADEGGFIPFSEPDERQIERDRSEEE